MLHSDQVQNNPEFAQWYIELQHLALQKGVQWLVSVNPDDHFTAYKKGLGSEEELAELEEVVQWRGCGCGG